MIYFYISAIDSFLKPWKTMFISEITYTQYILTSQRLYVESSYHASVICRFSTSGIVYSSITLGYMTFMCLLSSQLSTTQVTWKHLWFGSQGWSTWPYSFTITSKDKKWEIKAIWNNSFLSKMYWIWLKKIVIEIKVE